jgi:hypothetical protein
MRKYGNTFQVMVIIRLNVASVLFAIAAIVSVV